MQQQQQQQKCQRLDPRGGIPQHQPPPFSAQSQLVVVGAKPNVITCNAALSDCNITARQALALLKEMKRQDGVEPDAITYQSVLEACFRRGCYSDTLRLLRLVCGHEKTVPTCTEEHALTWDLHDLSLATSCMLVSAALLATTKNAKTRFFKRRRQQQQPPAAAAPVTLDVRIITGRGLHSDPNKGPVLQSGVRSFLQTHFGPTTVNVKGNDGCFMVTKESLTDWIMTRNYRRFRKLILRPKWMRRLTTIAQWFAMMGSAVALAVTLLFVLADNKIG